MIKGKTIAKREENGVDSRHYLLKDGKWTEDSDHVVMDHLVGFDPSEPEDSPYGFGSTDIMDEMEAIPGKEAVPLINRQILDVLKEKWKGDFTVKKEAGIRTVDGPRNWSVPYLH